MWFYHRCLQPVALEQLHCGSMVKEKSSFFIILKSNSKLKSEQIRKGKKFKYHNSIFVSLIHR